MTRTVAMAGVGVALVALSWSRVEAQAGRPQWPSAPQERGVVAEGLPVSPFFEGWYENPDGTYTLSFGYFNRNREEALNLPLGPDNFIVPAEYDGIQPTMFTPGRDTGVFTVQVPGDFAERGGRVVWTLRSQETSSHAVPGKVGVEAYRLHYQPMAMGSLPPMLKLQPDGPELWGPMTLAGDARQISAWLDGGDPVGRIETPLTLAAAVGSPLSLTVWVADRLAPDAEREPVQGGATWSTHRGPAPATFSEMRPKPDPVADGRADTTVTFTEAGEYVLRVRADNFNPVDSTPPDQCCWTNGYLKVVVTPQATPPSAAGNALWFEGATLIVGDGGAPLEHSAFLVEDGVFTWVGAQGEMEAPVGATRVDLTGKTVIPALIDAHQHIGLTNVKDGTNSQDNYTRENVIEHLERSAYHGVAATMSLGLEVDEELAFQLRDERIPNAARFLTSGRGIAATSMAGPQQAYRLGIPRGALTEAEGRAAVRELQASNVDLVKIWVDGRGGAVPKVEPDVYRAIINEAHAHGMRVVAHVGTTSALEDAKDLLRAGIDGFAHTIRDRDVDETYLALVRQYPEVWTIPNLPGSPVTREDLPWLSETLPPFEIDTLREQIEHRETATPSGPADLFQLQCRNLAKHHDVGMRIGMGTDSGTSVAWTTHAELRDMVACGLSPMEAIEAATRINAEILGLDQLGMVATGKHASFVILDADPREDINNTRRIAHVYLSGEEVDREALRSTFMDGVR